MKPKYQSSIFDPISLQHAKDVVLTPESNWPEKFEVTTKFFVDILEREKLVQDSSVVLDFGVGMGRVSKELIDRFNCKVVGTDISLNMLIHATGYVNKPQNFVTCNRVTYVNSIDLAIACFVLQHVEDPVKEIDSIFEVVKPGGYFVLLNDPRSRFVPGDWRNDNSIVWFDDGFKVFDYVETKFEKVKEVLYIDNDHHVIIYRKP